MEAAKIHTDQIKKKSNLPAKSVLAFCAIEVLFYNPQEVFYIKKKEWCVYFMLPKAQSSTNWEFTLS